MIRVSFVTNYIPEYRYPVFERLMRIPNLQLEIFTSSPLSDSCNEARASLPIRYSRTLNIQSTTRHGSSGTLQKEQMPVPISLVADLFSSKPHIIVSGDFGLRSLLCWITARLLRAKFVLWSEEIATSARGRSWLQLRMRKFLSGRADACLAWGEPAKNYLQSLGVRADDIFCCAQAVDNVEWIKRAETINRDEVRRDLGLSGKVFLFVGRLVERKGARNLLQAWSRANLTDRSATLVIVGSGEQEAGLMKLVSDLQLHNVLFVGAKNGLELACYYAAADVFVFPSLEDVWGLVVNEALCFGLPIMGSQFAGSSQQLLEKKDLFNPVSIDEFAEQIRLLVASTPSIDTSKKVILLESVTFDHSVDAIVKMIKGLGDSNISAMLCVGGVALGFQSMHVKRIAADLAINLTPWATHLRRVATNAVFMLSPYLVQLRRVATNLLLCIC